MGRDVQALHKTFKQSAFLQRDSVLTICYTDGIFIVSLIRLFVLVCRIYHLYYSSSMLYIFHLFDNYFIYLLINAEQYKGSRYRASIVFFAGNTTFQLKL